MKLLQTYITIFFLSFTFLSCSSDDAPANTSPLVTQIDDVATDGSIQSTSLKYNDSKIVSIENSFKQLSFGYTGDLITSVIEFNKETNATVTFSFIYTNGILTQMSTSNNYQSIYSTNADGSIAYATSFVNTDGSLTAVNSGILYFSKSNLIKEKIIVSNTDTGIITTTTKAFTYDSKNNPFANITGFSALLNYSSLLSVNNVLKATVTEQVEDTVNDQITSSIGLVINSYTYNSSSYPTEISGEKSIFGSDLNHDKTIFYY